jgi:hypothetical protein
MKKINLIGFVLLLAGCGVFEPVPESYKNRIAETTGAEHNQEQQETDDHDQTLIITPSTWFGPATTDVVDYVNIVTGETATGPSIGGYLDNHSDWVQAPMESILVVDNE